MFKQSVIAAAFGFGMVVLLLAWLIWRTPQMALALIGLVGLTMLAAFLAARAAAAATARTNQPTLEKEARFLNPLLPNAKSNNLALTTPVQTDDRVAGVPARALLEATMESMREGVVVVDRALRVVTANKAASDIFAARITGGKLIGERLTTLTRNTAVHQAFQTALERSARAEVKVETTNADARGRRAFDVRVAPLRYVSNNPVHDNSNAHTRRDETEVDNSAFRNSSVNDASSNSSFPELETGGAVGVFFDITRLERLERVRQEFLSNVSHELRTPLTAILTFIETLQTGAVDNAEDAQRFLAIINRNAERMNNLIGDILELSAIEAGTVRVKIAPVNLSLLVDDVLSAQQPRAAARGIKLYNRIAHNTTVYADVHRLEQMLTNLVSNAIKFSGDVVSSSNANGEDNHHDDDHNNNDCAKEASVSVTHQFIEAESSGDAAPQTARDCISVTDNGEGIAAEHLPRIFERFYRIDRARSNNIGGTGLGLAIVKHLARAHQGEATATSTLGSGSTFSIELPHPSPKT